MSYQAPRAPTGNANDSTGQNSGQAPPSSSSTQSSNNPATTPIDWSNYMSFQQSPGHFAQQSSSSRSRDRSMDGADVVRQGAGSPGDNFQTFAQGIAMTRPSPTSINFAHPQFRSNTPQNQPGGSSSLNQSQQQFAGSDETNRPSSSVTGKGKSPVTSTSQPATNDPSNGLSLDPSAFSRDIRFQVPPFLSNSFGGAPTFPPGGEAWSGFSPGNLFDTSGSHQLTPGTLFGSSNFSNQDGYNDGGGTGRNVLEGLSGFMNEGGWETWGDDKDSPPNNNNFGTTFYVNPNPSPSILAPKQDFRSQDISRRQNVPPITVNGAAVHQNRSQTAKPAAVSGPSATSPLSSSTGTMPTSALFNQQNPAQAASTSLTMPSLTADVNSQSLSTGSNIASSSTQPYAPPQNTQSLLQGPTLPPNLVGTSLTDGPGLYSTTGFDMVGILARVANRKDPKTQLGPVDFSCSFVVVDIRRYDSPIVYASPTFSALTGYDQAQIVGRNCRFLQSPEGEVVKGSKRKYTDNVAVAHFKRMLNAGKECQASLINYRRGGMPFINLVTVIPIPWEGTEIVYHVGFQVDLVEQPNAILRNMRDGSYQVNYTVTNIPQAPLRPPTRDLGGVGLSADIIDIMGAKINMPGFATGEEGGKMEWLKMILENADDFVHVLSLKGMFQYVSPSVRRVLEYEPEDLINKNMSDVCHPSDIVPLMRELKDSTHAPVDGNSARTVNLVFRIRRKSSGYVWIECTGRLHVEPGKGRKAVILSGRARSVPTLPWEAVARHGGLADKEFWTRIAFDGLVLHSTSSVVDVLGYQADEIVGKSIFSLLSGGVQPSVAPPSMLSLVQALQQTSRGEAMSGAITVNAKMLLASGAVADVQMVCYSTRPPVEDTSRSDSDSSVSSSSRPSSTSSSVSGIRPSSLVVQIKLLPTRQSRPIVHPPTANVFEELETTRGTSWQYELHQLRLLNRRLKEDISALRARGKSGNKGKKRKASESLGSNLRMTAMPEQYSAAPKHQLTPGFGLVAPGMPSPYYQ